MNPASLDTPARRYGALSQMLSSARFLPRAEIQNPETDFFPARDPGAFCGRWRENDIAAAFAETGCLAHWKSRGFHRIEIEIAPQSYPDRHQFTVWTEFDGKAEILMQIVVWLDFVAVDSIGYAIPSFSVEHLRLQTPGAHFDRPHLPGQDFAPSGILRRIFSIIGKWALSAGARVIAEIPEYFHTAYIFGRYFRFADAEMESIFSAMKRDLVPSFSHRRVADISQAFEDGHITYHGKTYLWPTELQIYPLDGELGALLARFSYPEIAPGTFSCTV